MRPLLFVLPHGLVFLAAFMWAYAPEWKIVRVGRKESLKEGSKDAGSLKVIMGVMQLGLTGAIAAAFVKRAMVPAEMRIPVFYAGVFLLIAGSVLRRICFRALGEHFTGDVKARQGQPVIQNGPYRWVRHPSYTAGTMINVAIGFALTNWLSIAVLFVATVISYGYRVHVEERALVLELGAPYSDYMRTHKRFIPFIV
jgi:protein-S-isoprenylcysteine O-methyltransferase Ste14